MTDMTDINAAVVRAPKAPMTLETLQLDAPRADEVLVRVVATGVCHTDISMRDQLYPVPHPIVLGHEGAGVVMAVGAGVTKVGPGDHVVMTFNSCGQCASCYANRPQYCFDSFGRNFGGARPDGSSAISGPEGLIHANFFGQSSFADHALCHERNVVKVRKDVPLQLLGPLACGIQTGAGAVLNVIAPEAGESVVIFGAGSVGLAAVMAARLTGAGIIIAIDLHDSRLAMALEVGATHVINAASGNTLEQIKAVVRDGANYALDTTGSSAVIATAVSALAPCGICGLIGAPSSTATPINLLDVMASGKTIRGIVQGDATPDLLIPRLIDLYSQGRFPFDKLIRFYEFTQINQAFADSEKGLTIKPVIHISTAV